MDNQLRQIIEEAWNDRALLAESRVREAVRAVIEELDKGRLRTAEPIDPSRSQWQVNEWVKKAILLYFPMQEMRTMRAGELEWHDKMDLKHGYEELGVRVVPHAVARYGAYISPGAILMPSYVNIGAWVGAGTMVDTWATVGSCAQVGERVHLSGGVGVGGHGWALKITAGTVWRLGAGVNNNACQPCQGAARRSCLPAPPRSLPGQQALCRGIRGVAPAVTHHNRALIDFKPVSVRHRHGTALAD